MLENSNFQAFVTKIRTRIQAFLARYDTQIGQAKQKVGKSASELDLELAQRYPERYAELKQKANRAKGWYDEKLAEQTANPDRPLVADRNYQKVADRLEDLGEKVADKEREVRNKIAAKLRSEPPQS